MFRLLPERPNVPFTRLQPVATVLSTVLVALGLFSAWQIYAGRARVGTDFAGGLALELKTAVPLTADRIRGVLDAAGLPGADVQEVRGRSEVQWRIRLAKTKGNPGEAGDLVLGALKAANPGGDFSAPMVEDAGPAFSKKLQQDAFRAVGLSFVGILIYVAFRFEFWFAVAAIVASFHDVFVTLGLLTLFGFEFNLLIVSAMLILLGYSLHDTVVIFDRMRENIRVNPAEPIASIVHRSLNETLSRTILTGGITLFTLIVLFVVAPGVLQGFSVGLLIGILIGTYSSLFIAAPLVVWLRR